MKLIVGLGNPGNQYNFTRHNLGFLTLDFYAKRSGFNWQAHPKFNAIWAKHGETIFIKPQTFYNESGRSVLEFVHFYKLDLSDVYIICDDFNLDFGATRHRDHGSDGGNNGLKSCINQLGSNHLARLRIGTANDTVRKRLGDTDFVLSRFTDEEREQLPQILAAAEARINEFLA